MDLTIRAIPHDGMTRRDLSALRALFDAEYFNEFGDWNPEQPYGYASHDVHVIASCGDETVGHVGWARRRITVGGRGVVIAGVGGVLVADAARGLRLGERLMRETVASMRDVGGIEFGYLGCREEVVPFYQSCGWKRVAAVERSLNRDGLPSTVTSGPPILIFPLHSSSEWPDGEVDLRGRAW